MFLFFFSSRRRHTRSLCDWSSDVCSSDLMNAPVDFRAIEGMFKYHYKQIEVRFDPEYAIAWTYMKPTGAPCFNLGMLEELRAHDNAIESCGGRVLHKGELQQIHYYVGGSKIEGIFSLGGNLATFVCPLKSGDLDTP